MPDNDAHVVLVTADARLRTTIRRQRPPDVRLTCTTSTELAEGKVPVAREWWVDLDTAPDVTTPPGARRVCFQSRRRSTQQPTTADLVISKPCTAAVAKVLWSRVERTATKSPARRGARPGWLPHWALTLHELGLRELCRKCVNRLRTRLGYAHASMYLYEQEDGVLTLAETTHTHPVDLAVSMQRDDGHLMVAVARSGKILATSDAASQYESRHLQPPKTPRRYADGRCLIAPLTSGGRLWGVLNFSCAERTSVTEVGLPLEPLFAMISRSLRYARAYDRARTQARIDPLTGLYNNRWVMETLAKEIRRSARTGTPLAVIALDLDGLKEVNDHAGHPAGDCLLQHVAGRITAALRESDSAARVGGDEFVAVLPATDLEGARSVARRVLQSTRSDAAMFRNVPLPIGASLGVAQWQPDWTTNELIEAADNVMYQAKRQGGNQLVCRPRATGPAVRLPASGENRVWPEPNSSEAVSARTAEVDAASLVPQSPTRQAADSAV